MPLDMSGPLRSAIDSKFEDAKKQEAAGNQAKASQLYREASRLMHRYADTTKLADVKQQRLQTAKVWADLSKALTNQKQPVKTAVSDVPKSAPPQAGQSLARPTASSPSESDDALGAQVDQLISKASITWNDIGGLEETKRQIKLAYGLEFIGKPEGVNIQGWRKILLYGPPGTGKTLLAAATSNQLDATFYNVRLDSILSKFFGESSKLIHALFDSARNSSPSVIFVDEIDAVAGKRGGEQASSDRRLVNTFLTELDGMTGKDDDSFVLVMAATNRPWDLDEAMLSRFEKNVLVPLPDSDAREAIIKNRLDKMGFPCEVPVSELAEMTEGYSGREIEQIASGLVMMIVESVNPTLSATVDKGPEALAQNTLKIRPITREDWDTVLASAPPKVTSDVMDRLRQFEESFE